MSLSLNEVSLIRTKIKGDKKAESILENMLKEGKKTQEIVEFFNINPKMKQVSVEQRLNTAYNILNESYKTLTIKEKLLVSLVESENKTRVFRQVRLIEALTKNIPQSKEKEFTVECLTALKSHLVKGSLKETAEKTVELKKAVSRLIEAEDSSGGFVTVSLGNGKYLKDMKLAILQDEQTSPESLYVTFSVPFYPIGDDFSSVKASLQNLDKKFGRLGRTILNSTLRQTGKVGKIFTGEGIWDGGVRINGIKPGDMSIGSGELVLHLIPGAVKSIKEGVAIIKEVLSDLDKLIPTWFEEVNKDVQKTFLKNKSPETQQRLDALKKQMRAQDDTDYNKGDDYGGWY